MKTILCYGDSLTWGYNAETLDRHAFEDRWPSVLAKALGPGVTVIAEGLNGRTTAYDDHLADCDRNGARILPTILHSHDPIDLVILFLGANDMKPAICGTAFGAVQGMERLVELVRHHAWSFDAAEGPEVLIVSPPPLCETANTAFAAMFAGGVEQSAMLATLYADLADERGCGFFDAGSVAETTPLDGVHLDARNTRAIGKGLEPVVRMMLGL
ncbi:MULTISPECIES: SGNH/GDSL hydrolase family protein [Shinella]|uniref:Lysophospholipase L1-like esterase n=1 Tax=Shinella granuli TaxID=323621 RepID=A0A4R2CP56_SHIGR|nr:MULTISPECIES: SGNH/GDSL hydrolase family protein [Shinella]ANH04296.1 arylesterase [Shinella sp. HZN7]TCN42375.1 lysophospholipase L1-like esterase [Shinella granuli]